MNLYEIILKNGKKYYVVSDTCNEALDKLNNYYHEYICKEDKCYIIDEWLEIRNIANNWNDLRVGVFE